MGRHESRDVPFFSGASGATGAAGGSTRSSGLPGDRPSACRRLEGASLGSYWIALVFGGFVFSFSRNGARLSPSSRYSGEGAGEGLGEGGVGWRFVASDRWDESIFGDTTEGM